MHHPINSPCTVDKQLISLSLLTVHDHTHFSLLFLLCEHFPLRILRGGYSFVCVLYVCASIDCCRSWQKVAFVINGDPGTRRTLRPSLGHGKTRGEEDRHTPIHPTPGEKTRYATVDCQMEMFWMRVAFLIIHADLKSHSEFSPKSTGHFLSLWRKTHCNILMFYINVQLIRKVTLWILSVTLS